MKHRVELFSDAVIAIIITIMVLDLHAPETGGWHAWVPVLPSLGIYAIGYFMVALRWRLHHLFFDLMETFSSAMMWCNFLFLFAMSLFPLSVKTLAEHPGDAADTVSLILVNLFTMIAGTALVFATYSAHKDRPGYRQMITHYRKMQRINFPLLLVQAGVAWYWPRVGLGLFVSFQMVMAFQISKRPIAVNNTV